MVANKFGFYRKTNVGLHTRYCLNLNPLNSHFYEQNQEINRQLYDYLCNVSITHSYHSGSNL